MKVIGISVVLAATVALVACAEEITAVQEGKGHAFACADYSGGKVFIVSPEGKVEWECPAPSCNDLWVLPNGNLLFVTGHGVREVTRDKKTVFEYQGSTMSVERKAKDGTTHTEQVRSEIYACQRLANGNTFVGECNSGKLLEVAPDGKIVKEVKLLPEGKDGGHPFIRNARRLANGNYLVAYYAAAVVKEHDPDGKVVLEIPAAGGPHSCIRLPNGNTLIACGDAKGGNRIFEADKEGKPVWEVKNGDLPGIILKFMTGLQRLPNGNTVMTNWVGHNNDGAPVHIIEVTPEKKVVWTFVDHKNMRTVSSIQLLDVPGDATKGEVIH
ncbi:MAG: hypothetical protein ABSE73_09215 [Planctomycetota bacterium]